MTVSNEDYSSKYIPSQCLQSQETAINFLTGNYSQIPFTVHIHTLGMSVIKSKEQTKMWLMSRWMNLTSHGALTTIINYVLPILWSCLGQLCSVWKWILLLENRSGQLRYKWHSLVQLLWFFRGKTRPCSQQGNLARSIYYKMWLHISACRMDSIIKKRKRALLNSNRHSESQKAYFNKIQWLQDRTVMTTFLTFSPFPPSHQYLQYLYAFAAGRSWWLENSMWVSV